MRPTSFFISVLYLFTVDFFFEQFALYSHLSQRNMKIPELFSYSLNKRKCMGKKWKLIKYSVFRSGDPSELCQEIR